MMIWKCQALKSRKRRKAEKQASLLRKAKPHTPRKAHSHEHARASCRGFASRARAPGSAL
eukprot:3067955-Pleurochrysis_carterae.AAC.2